MQDYKKDMKQFIFWNFRLSRGQPFETSSLPPANSTHEGQVGNCLFLTLHSSTCIYEPGHEISNNVVCATSKASDQPAHKRSLIRAFASRLTIL